MNGVHGMPGFDAVLREHKRLASKLTSEEFRAIRDYIDERVRQEQADVNFRLYALRNDYDVTVRRSSEQITELYQELNEKNDTLKQYQSSDQTVLAMYKQKEERWEKKQEMLINELQKTEGESAKVKTRLETLQTELGKQTQLAQELDAKLEEANKAVERVEEAERVIAEREQGRNEILKLKMEVDKRQKLIQTHERTMKALREDVGQFDREQKYNTIRADNTQKELRKQVAEVAEKCKELTELQFRLQMEERQAATLQKQLKHATEEVRNYKKILEQDRPTVHSRDPILITLKKDLDIMDIRIRSLDIAVRLRMDEIKKLEDRAEDVENESKLAAQVRKEIYIQGDTFLELTISELVKKFEYKKRRLQEELAYGRDWEQPSRDADVLRSELTAFMKQAGICKATELCDRAAKQIQKIDLIMRGTTDTFKTPRIYKVSDRRNSDNRLPKHQHSLNSSVSSSKTSKPAFITSSTPVNGFDVNAKAAATMRTRKRVAANVNRPRNRPPDLGYNHTDDSKIQYIDTVELDLSRLTPSSPSRRESQSDRMTLKSMSDSTIPAIFE
ncbi:hypothetical protein MAR_007955 [Mya arenaria]|uniref:Cilia- and flagella-associated protein 157 n=1 Tax=Mya arenaria TaxID=6604 RepID=A0ABY7DX57_MYAAR|nr:rho-associated protein kinase 2-like [Mya arenaria]XP_052798696.1 rho-associated protein kinase 2-like [Mya arenaria]XP_052798697.1 rho-associated protein kinase 2-like [Mya arenaria]WAR01397.1 hypothetical protein MAR_007955 [Mya arenaria]